MRRRLALQAIGLTVVISSQAFAQRTIYTWAGPYRFASGVAGAGDVNLDGFPDVLIGQPDYSPGSSFGRVHVESGRDSSLLYRFQGTAPFDNLGVSVAGPGDVNGDGYPDILAGAETSMTYRGYVTLFSGKDGSTLRTLVGDQDHDSFGQSVLGPGDVNGDGFPDLMIAAPTFDGTNINCGSVRLVSGLDGSLLFDFQGQQSEERWGFRIASAGDVNGDGVPDLMFVSLPSSGVGIDLVHVRSGKDGAEMFLLDGGALKQTSLAGVGDVNQDGFADFAIGDPFASNIGSVKVLSGKDGTTPIHSWVGSNDENRFGASVAGAGDVNGDGIPDTIVGSPSTGGGPQYAEVRSGSDGSLLFLMTHQPADSFGAIVAAVGDVNHDGLADVLVAAFNSSAPANQVYLELSQEYPTSSAEYGTGLPGTFGTPEVTVGDPILCSTTSLTLTNSSLQGTAAVLFVGVGRADVPTAWEGHLLVAPLFVLPLALPAFGLSLQVTVPCLSTLTGALVDLQVLEIDAGAAKGISFTPGWEIVIGVSD